jgi:hypothetical protein
MSICFKLIFAATALWTFSTESTQSGHSAIPPGFHNRAPPRNLMSSFVAGRMIRGASGGCAVETRIDEIGANVYRLSVFVPDVAPPAGFT